MAHGPPINYDEGDDDKLIEPPLATNKCMMWSVVLIAGCGGLLFGVDTAVISGVLLVLEQDHFPHLTKLAEEWIVTATLVGAAIGALVSGRASDRFGRRLALSIGALMFLAGAVLMAAAPDLPLLLAGRAVVGLGVGVASGIVPVYIAELSPPRIRGRLVTIQNVCITSGQFLAYLMNLSLLPLGTTSWRYMLGLCGVPALLLLAGVVCVLPESPRWLMARGRRRDALNSLTKVMGPAAAAHECRSIEKSMDRTRVTDHARSAKRSDQSLLDNSSVSSPSAVDEPAPPSWSELLHDRVLRKALIAGVGLQLFQQFCGINTAMYYSAVILQDAGFGGGNSTMPADSSDVRSSAAWSSGSSQPPTPIDAIVTPIALSCGVAGMNMLFTFVALGLMDRVGRRTLLLFTLPGAMAGMAMLGAGFSIQHQLPAVSGALTFIGLVTFVAFFALGMGPVPWAVNAEIYPTRVRSLAAGLATSANWIANIIVSATFLSLESAIGRPATFFMFGAICLLAILFVWRFVPETRGLSLEEIQRQLASDSNITGDVSSTPSNASNRVSFESI